jgi:hypothetical protein
MFGFKVFWYKALFALILLAQLVLRELKRANQFSHDVVLLDYPKRYNRGLSLEVRNCKSIEPNFNGLLRRLDTA